MKKIVITISKPYFGMVKPEDHEFGIIMLDKFLHSLEKSSEKPSVICFYTEGVKLVCEGSSVLMALQILQELGIKMIVCQTCLDYYQIREKVQVGEISGMNDIVAQLTSADLVIDV